jgi:hypothetical protein
VTCAGATDEADSAASTVMTDRMENVIGFDLWAVVGPTSAGTI